MRHFRYHRPTTLAAAAELMVELGDEAEFMAGGTSLMALAKLGLAEPEQVIALSGLDDLRGLARGPDDGLRLGALTTMREVERSPLVAQLAPGIAEAAGQVATVRIRNQATVGGNLVHADPNQDLPPMLMVHDAVARLVGPAGEREVPVEEMFVGFFESAIEPGEILESVRVPPVPAALRTGYLKFLPRTQDDYATVAVAVGVVVADGRFADVRIAVAGGGPTAVRCRAAEAVLVGEAPDPRPLAATADTVTEALAPVSDGRGSGHYKREMARVCTQRLLQRLTGEYA